MLSSAVATGDFFIACQAPVILLYVCYHHDSSYFAFDRIILYHIRIFRVLKSKPEWCKCEMRLNFQKQMQSGQVIKEEYKEMQVGDLPRKV